MSSNNWDPLRRVRYAKTKLYYSNEDVRVYHGDALELLPLLPEDSVQTIFSDPPYYGNQSGLLINRTDGHSEGFNTRKAKWAYAKNLVVQLEFHRAWLRAAQRALKVGGTAWVTGTYHSIGVINVVLQDLGFKLLNEIVLVKRNAPPNFTGSRFRALSESMLWAKKNRHGKTKFNYWTMKNMNGGVQMNNVWEYSARKNPFRHPATKQPIILERCLLAASDECDLVVDPFAGSGTTGYVAQELGRKCILIEVDEKYCETIAKRLDGEFGAYVRTDIP